MKRYRIEPGTIEEEKAGCWIKLTWNEADWLLAAARFTKINGGDVIQRPPLDSAITKLEEQINGYVRPTDL